MQNNILAFQTIQKELLKHLQCHRTSKNYSKITYARVKPHKVANVHNKTEATKCYLATKYSIRMPASFCCSSQQKRKISQQSMLCRTAFLRNSSVVCSRKETKQKFFGLDRIIWKQANREFKNAASLQFLSI